MTTRAVLRFSCCCSSEFQNSEAKVIKAAHWVQGLTQCLPTVAKIKGTKHKDSHSHSHFTFTFTFTFTYSHSHLHLHSSPSHFTFTASHFTTSHHFTHSHFTLASHFTLHTSIFNSSIFTIHNSQLFLVFSKSDSRQ